LDKIIIGAVIPIIVTAIFTAIASGNEKERLKNEGASHVLLRMPRAYVWIGGICAAFFTAALVLMLVFPIDEANLAAGIVFGVFVLIGFLLMTAALVWRIDLYIDRDYFTVRGIFGKYRQVRYADCKSCEVTQYETVVKCHKGKGRRVSIDPYVANTRYLIAMLEKHGVPVDRPRLPDEENNLNNIGL